MKRSPAALLLAALVLASSFAAAQGSPSAAADEAPGPRVLAVEYPMADGAVLRGHVHLPAGEGPFGVVLVFSPYWDQGGGFRSTLINFRYAHLFEAGFALAFVSLRGSGGSDGCFSYMNVPQDGADAAEVVEALAKEPWSNGNIGMYGISYMAAVQYSLLAHGAPDALKALVPMSGTVDVWNLLGRNGAARLTGTAHPIDRDLHQGLGLSGTRSSPGRWQPTPNHYCASTLEGELAYQELAVTGDKDEWFEARDVRAAIAGSTVPLFATSGLASGEGHILQFDGLWDLLDGPKRFLLGQWGHAYPEGCDSDRPPGTCRTDFLDLVVGFFDEHLRGGPAVTAMNLVEYQDDALTWHTATSWPPPATQHRLHLSAGELLARAEDVDSSAASFHSAPVSPNPGRCLPSQALYVSEPFTEEVLVAGHFLVDLTLASTEAHGHVAAHLYQTAGTGPCPERGDELSRAVSTLRHRGGHLAEGAEFPTDRPDLVLLRSEPFATTVPAGNRLILALGGGSANFLPRAERPLLTAFTGDGHIAELVLPIASGNLRFPNDVADVAPTAPRGLKASAEPGDDAVTLRWQAPATRHVEAVQAYHIHRAEAGREGGRLVATLDADARSFTDAGLEAGTPTAYVYSVRAENARGVGAAAYVCASPAAWPTADALVASCAAADGLPYPEGTHAFRDMEHELMAASGFGSAHAGAAAASGVGDSSASWLAVSGTNSADAYWVGITGTGDSRGSVALALTGDATSNGYVAVSVLGHANGGRHANVGGCDVLANHGLAEACAPPSSSD